MLFIKYEYIYPNGSVSPLIKNAKNIKSNVQYDFSFEGLIKADKIKSSGIVMNNKFGYVIFPKILLGQCG